MKNILITILLFFSFQINAQVGIGTTAPEPSSILDIQSSNKGVLFPRMTSSERDLIANPTKGLILFNTDLNKFEFNSGTSGTPIWEIINQIPSGNSVKYSNIDTATNLNQASFTNIPIFGNLNWNDNTSVFSLIDSSNLQVNTAGRYKISVNISYYSTVNRMSIESQIAINGIGTSTICSTGYIRNSAGHQNSSLNYKETLNLNAGDIISVSCQREASNGTALFRSIGTSNIIIEYLK